MSTYKMPESAYKRLSLHASDYGLLYNLTKRIIPVFLAILFIIFVCVVLAYSLNGRAVPRQFVAGTYTTAGILVTLFIILSVIRCCRPKCAGKHNLRLEPPATEPVVVPEMTAPEWDNMGHRDFRPKHAPMVTRQGRESTALSDICDRVKQELKDWLDEHHPFRHYRDNVQPRAPAHAPRERDQPVPIARHAPHNQGRRENAAEIEGVANAEAKDHFYRQRDRNNRRVRDDAQRARDEAHRAHQAYYESDENRSQDSDSTEVEPPRAVLRQDFHHYNLSPRQMERVLATKNLYLKLPAPAHNPRR